MTLEVAFQIALTIIAALGGMWLRQVQSDTKELREEISNIRETYMRKDDAHREFEKIMSMLERIDRKLDQKADKS